MKKEIPILFSTPMVQAILEGRKTMTRRVVKFPKDFTGEVWNNGPYGLKYSSSLYGETVQRLAYALPGDLLWVRESFVYRHKHDKYYFKADHTEAAPFAHNGWKPSIHMPKAAARIWLEVTDVRVERLHGISEEDAKAEGILHDEIGYKDYMADASGYGHPDIDYPHVKYAQLSFKSLWQSINGEESWNANPWVWVVSFKTLSTTGKP